MICWRWNSAKLTSVILPQTPYYCMTLYATTVFLQLFVCGLQDQFACKVSACILQEAGNRFKKYLRQKLRHISQSVFTEINIQISPVMQLFLNIFIAVIVILLSPGMMRFYYNPAEEEKCILHFYQR